VELTDCGDGEARRGTDGMETGWAAGCGGERAEGCAADCVGEDHCCVRGTGNWGWMGDCSRRTDTADGLALGLMADARGQRTQERQSDQASRQALRIGSMTDYVSPHVYSNEK
jgi:hypothetical protein